MTLASSAEAVSMRRFDAIVSLVLLTVLLPLMVVLGLLMRNRPARTAYPS